MIKIRREQTPVSATTRPKEYITRNPKITLKVICEAIVSLSNRHFFVNYLDIIIIKTLLFKRIAMVRNNSFLSSLLTFIVHPIRFNPCTLKV